MSHTDARGARTVKLILAYFTDSRRSTRPFSLERIECLLKILATKGDSPRWGAFFDGAQDCPQSGFPNDCGEIRPRVSLGQGREGVEVDSTYRPQRLEVTPKDSPAATFVGPRYFDMIVEATWTSDRRIDSLKAVRCGDHLHTTP